ncbi:c-type cytochrome [Marinobacter sp.]|uniref:c-type cytochrome n=1 Tax=Marinobacter sp. TaxID=50741 RepID=UPI0035651949
MKLLPTILIAIGAVILPGWATAAIDGDAEKGKEAAGVCVACHQADGTGKNNPDGESWPQLAGLDAAYIAKQLNDYKSGQRENGTMKPFANMLSEQQIADVAAYYSELAPEQGQGGEDADEATLARGEMLAQRGDWSDYIVSCKSCHGPDNQGAGEVFPGIAGQHAGYIEAQLKAWQEGTRKNDPQDLMGTIARRMSDEDIRAVAAWLSTQPPQSN